MRKRLRRLQPGTAVSGALAALACLLVSLWPLLLPAGGYHPQLWRGYATALLRCEEIPARALAGLQRLPGVEAVLCLQTAQVRFNAFDGMESIPLSRLPARLQDADPRYDPWLKALPHYFRLTQEGAAWSVVYLRSRLNPLLLYPGVRRIAGESGVGLRMLEFDPGLQGLLAGLAAAFLLGLLAVRLRRRENPVLLAASLPWLVNLAGGGPEDLLAFLLLFPFLLLLLEEWTGCQRSPRPLPARLARFGLLWLGANLLLLSPFEPARLFLRTAVASGLGLAVPPLIRLLMRRSLPPRGHTPFEPLPILPRRLGPLRVEPARPAWVALALPLLIVSLPLAQLEKRSSGLAVPAPASPARAPIGWESLERLYRGAGEARLPDLSDFVTHAAYQEGLPFGRPYRFPAPDERLTLSAYLSGGGNGAVVQTRRTVKRYPPGWLAGTLSRVEPLSVEGLLRGQGAAVAVSLEHEASRQLRQMPRWRIPFFGLFFLLFALGWDLDLTERPWYGTHKRLIRRKYPIQ